MVPGLTDEHETRIAAAWSTIVDAIAAGDLARNALTEHGLSKTSVRRWRLAAPERMREWAAAFADSADALRDEHLATARNDEMDPSRLRARCNALEWQMAKRDPERYAERSRHDINVKTLDYTGILARAEARLAAQATARIIEAEVLAVPAPDAHELM